MKIFFDETPFQSADGSIVKVQFDTIDDINRVPEMELRFPIKRLASAYAEKFPEYGEKAFYEAKEYDDTSWGNWVIRWIKEEIMNQGKTIEAMEESKNKYKAFYHQAQEYISKRDLKITQLEMELKELKGSIMTVTRESNINRFFSSDKSASFKASKQA